MTDLGFMNGWREEPELYREAVAKGYKFKECEVRNCLHKYVCEELGFYFYIDSYD